MRHFLQGRRSRYLLQGVSLISALAAGAQVCVIFTAARHGFDFTDEGFYLNSIAHSSEGASHVSSFGQVYRPLAFMMDGDIRALRWFNISVILLAGAVVGWALVTRSKGRQGGRCDWADYGFILAIAASTLGFFGTGLFTPSYSSLAATGVLLVAAGLVLVDEDPARQPRLAVSAILIGLGGVATFLGKPSAALATAVVVGIALLASGTRGRLAFATSLATAAFTLLVVSWTIAGSPVAFLQRLWQSVSDAKEMQADHDLTSALTAFGLPQTSDHALAVSLALSTTAFAWSRSWLSPEGARWRWLLASGILASVVAYLLVGRVSAVSYFVPTRALVLAAAPVGVILAMLLTRRLRSDRATWVLVAALLLLPHAWVFGSNNDYWHGASLLYVLWFAGGVVLLGSQRDGRSTGPIVAAPPMVLLTAVVIAAVLAAPYRQVVPLFAQETPTSVGPSGTLLLAPDFAAAIEDFRREAGRAGFTPRTPVLDLSGQMPGLIYALEGTAAGAAWMIGGYPGSDAVALRTLARTSCRTLAQAWLIYEPGGTRAIDPSVLSAAGATLDDWELVTSESISTTAESSRRIILLAPNDAYADRVAACETAR